MSDAKRIDAFVSIGNEAAALLVSLADEVVRLREALAAMVYETTHLSPMEVNGDHRCRISAAALTRARAALMAHTRENAE
jgi:hypothetical protein